MALHLLIFLSLSGVAVSSPVHQKRCSLDFKHRSATLTFFTGYDLSNTKTVDGFSVVWHGNNGTVIEPVVECFWFTQKQPRCLNRPGYKCDKKVTEQVRITIANYRPEQHDGKYILQVFPLVPEGNIECVLPQNSELHETSTVASSTSRKSEVDAKKTDGRSDSQNALLIVTVVLVSVTLLFVGVHGIVIVKKWWRPKKTAHDSSEK